jgi:hypothetical protein
MLFLSAIVTVGLCVIAFLSVGERRTIPVIDEIRRVHTAQVDFYSSHGRYANSLAELSPMMLSVESTGYRLTVEGHGNSYTVHAEPLQSTAKDRVTFYTDETLIVRRHRGPGPATAESEPLK